MNQMTYLTIVGPDEKDKCRTPIDCHGYSKEVLQSMVSAGCKFKVDNKIISLTKLCEMSSVTGKQPDTALNLNDATASKASDNKSGKEANKKTKIRCIETGDLFDRQSEAAKFLKIDPAAVSDSLKTGRKRAGYTFDRVEV